MIEGLTFREADHTYWFKGVHVPNVTSILEPVYEWDRVPADVLEAARQRGTAVHKACELWSKNDLDEDDLDPVLVPYLAGWKKFCAEQEPAFVELEGRVFHPRHRYAGTLDVDCVIRADEWLIDIKTGGYLRPYDLQTAAYVEARAAEMNVSPARWKRACCLLQNNGTYRLHYPKNTQQQDFAVFLSLLNVHRWRNAA